jgi:glycogen debranching enzyme
MGEFDILAPASTGIAQTRVLKHDETFSVSDPFGDLIPDQLHQAGLYHRGTRFLSHFAMKLGRDRPSLLSSTVIESNDQLAVDLSDRAANVHLHRSRFLWDGVLYERIRISNYGPVEIEHDLSFEFGGDFADIFEVRGTRRTARGRSLPPTIGTGEVVLGYEGLDDTPRRTSIRFSPEPRAIDSRSAHYDLVLPTNGSIEIDVVIACEIGPAPANVQLFQEALEESERSLADFTAESCQVTTANEQFNTWIERSISDLMMLVTDGPHGPYPYAGVPWFSTFFGRDGVITALELLWFQPRIAKGVLSHLAATQAKELEPSRDAEPGKILHESREGEMAGLGEIPFGRYYGTVDATPLFVMLAGAYWERTGDIELIRKIWPSIEAALDWIDHDGDIDGDGFVDYAMQAERGLVNQGWKDSWDSVFHADGTLAQPPISLCEVQAYVYGARRWAARLALAMGEDARAIALEHDAELLRERFDRTFWLEDLQCYAIALDGKKQPCRVRTSNAGHALTTGIAYPHRAPSLARTLASPSFFSGWGVRTLATTEPRYNPMAYHNGSVWPHDNALIAHGLASYGLTRDAMQIAKGLFEASTFVDLHRLPELFCGFVRRRAEGPTLYPVACAPQSWAAGACFMVLESLLGLSIDQPNRRVTFRFPVLPDFLEWVRFDRLQVGDARVSVLAERYGTDVSIRVLERSDAIEIVVVK